MKPITSPGQSTVKPLRYYLGKKHTVFTLWTKTWGDRQKLLQKPGFTQQFAIIRTEAECIQHLADLRSGHQRPLLLVEPSRWKNFDGLFKKISQRKKNPVFLLDQSVATSCLAGRILVVDEWGKVVDEIETSFQ